MRLVRRLPEGPARADMESRAWGERKREERRDSSSSSWKLGEVRYFAERERVPMGWGMGGKVCVIRERRSIECRRGVCTRGVGADGQ